MSSQSDLKEFINSSAFKFLMSDDFANKLNADFQKLPYCNDMSLHDSEARIKKSLDKIFIKFGSINTNKFNIIVSYDKEFPQDKTKSCKIAELLNKHSNNKICAKPINPDIPFAQHFSEIHFVLIVCSKHNDKKNMNVDAKQQSFFDDEQNFYNKNFASNKKRFISVVWDSVGTDDSNLPGFNNVNPEFMFPSDLQIFLSFINKKMIS